MKTLGDLIDIMAQIAEYRSEIELLEKHPLIHSATPSGVAKRELLAVRKLAVNSLRSITIG